MDELLNEHEQGERVRSWLQKNALGLIGGLGLGFALIWGWGQWQEHRLHGRDAEAARYHEFEAVLAEPGNLEQAAKLLAGDLAKTPYAAMGALELARAQVDAGDEAAALATLEGANSKDPALAAVLRQRRAELLVSLDRAADAVQLIGDAEDAASLETLGDAQLRLGKPGEASDAYRQALRLLEEGSPARQVVEIKLADAGGQAGSP
ncbi:YfgM family protein [Luteimonas sp. e5]